MRIKRHSRFLKTVYTLLLFTCLGTLIVTDTYGQFNTYSPYTRFGLGDLAKSGFGQNLAIR